MEGLIKILEILGEEIVALENDVDCEIDKRVEAENVAKLLTEENKKLASMIALRKEQ